MAKRHHPGTGYGEERTDRRLHGPREAGASPEREFPDPGRPAADARGTRPRRDEPIRYGALVGEQWRVGTDGAARRPGTPEREAESHGGGQVASGEGRPDVEAGREPGFAENAPGPAREDAARDDSSQTPS